jgi:mRNA interferase RelE/StbE
VAYRIELSPRAQRDFKKLPKHIQPQIAKKIDALSEDPRPHGVEMLTDTDRLYRVRSGDYRVIYQIRDDVLLVLVVRIGDRKEIYKRISEL